MQKVLRAQVEIFRFSEEKKAKVFLNHTSFNLSKVCLLNGDWRL